MDVKPVTLHRTVRGAASSLNRQRLPFVMPDFVRYSWVSESAREVWDSRIKRVQRAWLDIEWRSVAEGVRECALIWMTPDSLLQIAPMWESARLSACRLETETARPGDGARGSLVDTSGLICVAVGALPHIERLRHAWHALDHEAVGTLLGYPSCCRSFFRDVWVDQRCLDTTWSMALNTAASDCDDRLRITLPEAVSPLANILWRWVGVRAVPHLPCRFDCQPTAEFGARMLDTGRKAGYAEEMEWIAEVLSWPVEWSGLHGIAEVKSPLLKIATRTDATAGKCIVQWTGTRYPAQGANGLRFPFKAPQRQMLTASPGYQRGLAHSGEASSRQTWRYADNGFESEAAMDRLHSPIVRLAREALAGESGNVIDLGCGNGMLVLKVCDKRSDLVPYGVDTDGGAIGHAQRLLPGFAHNFVQADLFDVESWDCDGTRRYALALLMPGRLVEVPVERATRLLQRLQSLCSRVLVYAYPDWDVQRSVVEIANQFGLSVQMETQEYAGYLR